MYCGSLGTQPKDSEIPNTSNFFPQAIDIHVLLDLFLSCCHVQRCFYEEMNVARDDDAELLPPDWILAAADMACGILRAIARPPRRGYGISTSSQRPPP